MAKPSSNLVVAAQAEAALTPEQRKYQQLVVKIEKLRAELLAWDEGVGLFAQAHTQRVLPLQAEMAAHRHRIALRLADLLASRRWSRADYHTLRRSFCELADDLVIGGLLDDAAETELEALYDQYAETSMDEERREALDEFKGMVEAVTGVDLGDEKFESEEALRQRMQERLQEQAQHQAEHQARQEEARAKRPARKSAAALKREAQAQEASQSVREVFRKLASALHPDRASDEADRVRRTALMKRANQAYAAQDLLSLFALQLEIEQVDAEHLSRASTQQVRHFNRVLSAQLDELKDELQSREASFVLQFGLDPWARLNPRKLGALLEDEVRQMRGALARARQELNQLAEPAACKRWIKDMRHEHKLDDEDAFDLPF